MRFSIFLQSSSSASTSTPNSAPARAPVSEVSPLISAMDPQPAFSDDVSLAAFDHEIASALVAEQLRQEECVNLIASENYASPRVLAAQGCVMTNKYAEGYPRKRYYGGCEQVDVVEQIAIDRARKLFGSEYANVQPHSGSQANAAVFMALLEPGDKILGMRLSDGGHLTHGAKPNFSGKLYQAEQYGVNPKNGEVDYAQIEELARRHRPKMLVAGFSAYSRALDWQRFRDIADGIGAWLVVDMAHVAGLVCTGLYPDPVPHAHVVTTTTHKTLRGPRGGLILSNACEGLTKKLNSAVFPGNQGGPLMHAIAAKAVCFQEALEDSFRAYQQQVVDNAQALVEIISERGFDVVSGGTDNHLFLISLIGREITGKQAQASLEKARIAVNKNAVPNDTQSPFVTSGLRIGTPAVTTRGFGPNEMKILGEWICDILDQHENEQLIADIGAQAKALCLRFPVYPESLKQFG